MILISGCGAGDAGVGGSSCTACGIQPGRRRPGRAHALTLSRPDGARLGHRAFILRLPASTWCNSCAAGGELVLWLRARGASPADVRVAVTGAQHSWGTTQPGGSFCRATWPCGTKNARMGVPRGVTLACYALLCRVMAAHLALHSRSRLPRARSRCRTRSRRTGATPQPKPTNKWDPPLQYAAWLFRRPISQRRWPWLLAVQSPAWLLPCVLPLAHARLLCTIQGVSSFTAP